MATGHSDYWGSVITSRAVLAGNQTDWFARGGKSITGGIEDTLLSHVVSAGFVLNLGGFFVSCNLPIIQRCRVYINGDIVWDFYFELSKQIIVSTGGLYIVDENILIEVKATNNDTIDGIFTVSLLGFTDTKSQLIMPGGYVYVWDSANEVWVKLAVNADGTVKVSTS